MNISFDRAKEIFLDALEITAADDRQAFLDRVCEGDARLRAEVEGLLGHHERIGSFLATVPRDPNATAGLDVGAVEDVGALIGPYRLLERLGEGGMGQVFVAEQTEPVRRKVALKVIKPGMDTREVVGRFEAERQALALMDHPNIARVLDGGSTPSGRPYFVMELVRGVSITEYCDGNHLTVRDRLELFVQVCQAIQHAHQKGIIHRDIKPSNVLVTEHDGRPVAKVIDFGVAKAVGAQLSDKTIYTRAMQLLGTPLYMSPEQAGMSGQDIDTRSDVYSLGVLLYELLTGTTPFDRDRFRTAGFDELRRIIREEEPARPSARLSTLHAAATTVSANRSTDPRRLTRMVRGELDWVVMKALEKDRNRRYESAAAFASDVQRYLADEPVQACPPSATYRLRKFVRRNKAVLATGAVIVLALVAAAGTIGWTLNERRERERQQLKERGERQQRGADEITRSVVDGRRLQVARRWPEALVLAQHARELVDHTEGQEALRPQVDELLKDVEMIRRLEEIALGGTDVSVGSRIGYALPSAKYGPAFRDYGIDVLAPDVGAVAEEIRKRPIAEYLIDAIENWARDEQDKPTRERLRAVVQKADPEGVLARWRVALDRNNHAELRRIITGPDVERVPPATLAIIGNALFTSGLRKEAIEWLRATHARHPDDFWINQNLAGIHARSDPPQWDEALRHYTAALALRPRSHMLYSNIGVALNQQGKRTAAMTAWKKALELQPNYAPTHSNIGAWFLKEKKYDQAEAALKQAIDCAPDLAMAHRNLGSLYGKTKRLNEALAFFNQALKLDPMLAEGYSGRGMIWMMKNESDKAVADFNLALKHDDKHADAYHGLGAVRERKKHYSDAVKWYETALRYEPELLETHYRLGVTYAAWGRHEARNGATKLSTELFDKAIAKLNDATKLDGDFAEGWYSLGNALRDRGQIKAALTAFEKAAAMKSRSDDGEYRPHFNLGNLHARLGEFPKAVETYRAAINADPEYSRPYINLANALGEQGDFAGSEKAATDALARDKQNPDAIVNIAAALDRQGRYADALAFLRRALEKFEGAPRERARLTNQADLYERFVPLQKQLPAILAGKKDPADAEARLMLGEICIAMKDFAAACRFYREVFAEYPRVADNLASGYRIDAAGLPPAPAAAWTKPRPSQRNKKRSGGGRRSNGSGPT